MFDLEKQISDWRRQMLAAGIKTPVPLEELEIHLREDIEQQIQLGTKPQQAFENSVQRIGHADELKSEFKKNCGTKCNTKWGFLLWLDTKWGRLWVGVLGLGVIGLVGTLILSLVSAFVFPRSAPVFFVHHWVRAWLPNYVTFTTFTISGLVIGFAGWNTKSTFLWESGISGMGLIGTMVVNLVCLFVFRRSDSVFFSRDWMHHWYGFYFPWTLFLILCLVLHFVTRFATRFATRKLQFKTTRE